MSAFHLSQEPDAPCDKFACAHRQLCSDQELACTAFLNYVQTGRVAHPHNHFPEDGKKHQALDSVTPIRHLYEVSMRQW
jgi:hypothetical protein